MKHSIRRVAITMIWTVLLVACATTQAVNDVATLNSTSWVLTELLGQTVLRDAPATMRFEGGRVHGSDGCNRYTTGYSASGMSLAIADQVAGTRMACTPEKMKQAEAFMSAIHKVRTYRIEDGNLLLLGAAGGILASLAPQHQELAGTSWRVTGYNNGKQAVVSVLRDSELTLAFSANGEASGSSGCNRYTGSYTSANSKLTISSVAATRRMCARPEGVMEQESQFMKALETVASARFEGNRLELRTAEGQLAVTLTSEPTIDGSAVNTSYTCGDLSVQLQPESQGGTLRVGSTTFSMTLVPTGSGARYEAKDEPSTWFWTKADRATLVIQGRNYPECTRQ